MKPPALLARSKEPSPGPCPGGMLVFLPEVGAGKEAGMQVRRQRGVLKYPAQILAPQHLLEVQGWELRSKKSFALTIGFI